MRKFTLAIAFCLTSFVVCAQDGDTPFPQSGRNTVKLTFLYNYNGSNEQYSSAGRNWVGSIFWVEYDRSLSKSFDLGVSIGTGLVAYRTYSSTMTMSEGTDLAYHFGLNGYYRFLPQYRSGYRNFDVYTVGRLGYCIGDKGYWEGSIGLGNEYYFNSHFGLSAEVCWGNNFFFKSNDWANFGHIQLQCSLNYRF